MDYVHATTIQFHISLYDFQLNPFVFYHLIILLSTHLATIYNSIHQSLSHLEIDTISIFLYSLHLKTEFFFLIYNIFTIFRYLCIFQVSRNTETPSDALRQTSG
uniref:Ovule protein n=1 Tax=Caenorhabditis tropicalis TaxID=1561998 RepID=A0A1I7TU14_9PELO